MSPKLPRWFFTILTFAALVAGVAAAETVPLTSLEMANLQFAGWRKPQFNQLQSGKPLAIAGRTLQSGIAVNATSTLWLELDGKVTRFNALVGVDDSAGDAKASVMFTLIGDDRRLWTSRTLTRGEAAQPVEVDLTGVRLLLLKIEHGADIKAGDLGDWGDARFTCEGARPRTLLAPPEPAVILTPKPPATPQINGPGVYGCRPGHPFIYRIPTTGERPMTFTADGLPGSLKLDAANGIITGNAPERGTFVVTLRAKNGRGESTRAFKIVSGDTLALTPPMGWNHWYAHYRRVTDAMMREAADVMVRTGMADVGYSYVNIDDCWMNRDKAGDRDDPLRVGPPRDAAGNILPNRHFPDMPALTAYIHRVGLKAGIYSSPGPQTCAGYTASYQHEEQDARQFAEWGFDFLKYDWCSYRRIAPGNVTLADMQKPYRLMGGLLQRMPRDMVFNLCQYGMGNVWEWGAEVGGHCWRTAGDLGGELNRIFDVALKNAEHREWSKPGAWNDPDYIQIGYIGSAHSGGLPAPCPLSANEQYAFMSLWSLMASPLFYSGDMSKLDDFTVNVLCNPEVIAIDQDPLGECARVIKLTPDTFVMVKTLADGTKAVGLCNRGDISAEISAKWSDLGVSGAQVLRDVWRERDIGKFENEYRVKVKRHEVVLLRVSPVKGGAGAMRP